MKHQGKDGDDNGGNGNAGNMRDGQRLWCRGKMRREQGQQQLDTLGRAVLVTSHTGHTGLHLRQQLSKNSRVIISANDNKATIKLLLQ